MRKDTLIIHAGAHPDPSTGAIMTPIFQTSTYVQEAPGVNKGFEYARSQNPTRKALEEAFAKIEGGQYGLAFGSGVAATDAVLRLLSPGMRSFVAMICMAAPIACSPRCTKDLD